MVRFVSGKKKERSKNLLRSFTELSMEKMVLLEKIGLSPQAYNRGLWFINIASVQ